MLNFSMATSQKQALRIYIVMRTYSLFFSVILFFSSLFRELLKFNIS